MTEVDKGRRGVLVNEFVVEEDVIPVKQLIADFLTSCRSCVG